MGTSRFIAEANGELLYPFDIDEDALAGTVVRTDLPGTALRPADRIISRDGHFWTLGPDLRPGTKDDQRARLYGVNLSFEANFPAPEQTQAMALRLRKLGFNAVRLHHLDTLPGPADASQPRSVLTLGPYPSFNEQAINRLRKLIDAFSAQGIYVNLNLRVGYIFHPDKDGVTAYDPAQMKRPIATPILVYDPHMRALQQQYARELIQRLGLRGNPALAMVEINNEASLLAAWQHREWADAIPPAYKPQLQERWKNWLIQRYGSLQAACQTWGRCTGVDPSALLAPTDAETAPASNLSQQAQRAWTKLREYGSNLLGPVDPITADGDMRSKRQRDFIHFLADTDREYYDAMAATVRQQTDEQIPITGTQIGYGGAPNLMAQENMDYIDEHFYVDHPYFSQGHANQRDWRIWNVSLTGNQMDRLLKLAFLRDRRKPFVVSEYNHPFPSRQGAEILPLMAAFASLQDWDGLFFFDYANAATWSHAPANFTLRGDWGKYVLTGQSARLFRNAELPPLQPQIVVPMDSALQVAIAANSDKNALWKHLAARWGLSPEQALSARIAADPLANTKFPAFPAQNSLQHAMRHDFSYDATAKLFRLQTPTSWGLFGIPDKNTAGSANGMQVTFQTPSPNYLSILLSALDDRPLASSCHLLLTLGSATVGSQPGSQPVRPKQWQRYPTGSNSWTLEPDPDHHNAPSASRQSMAPAWLRIMPMQLSWPSQSVAKEVSVYPLNGAGKRQTALPATLVRVENGRIQLQLHSSPEFATPWFEISCTNNQQPLTSSISKNAAR